MLPLKPLPVSTLTPKPILESDWKDNSCPKGVEALKNWLKAASAPSHARFASYDSKTGDIQNKGGVCHAGTADLGVRDAYITNNNSKSKKKIAEPFLKWFLYESPYSFLIVNKDDYKFCRDHGFVFSVDAPYTLVHLANITSRHFSECTAFCFEMFNYLVNEKNVDGLIAYSICFLSNISITASAREDAFKKPFQGYSGHRATSSYTIDSLFNILTGNPVHDLGVSFREKASIFGSSKLWQSNSELTISTIMQDDSEFKQLIKKSRSNGQPEVYRPPNPFVRKPHGEVDLENQITIEEAVEILAPYVHQTLYTKLVEYNKTND